MPKRGYDGVMLEDISVSSEILVLNLTLLQARDYLKHQKIFFKGMEAIHISLPVTVCRDILLSQQQNLFYEASISTGAGNAVKKTKGSISARLVSGPNGDKLIDIVVQFPAWNKSLNFVKGKIYCQVEVNEKQNANLVLDSAVHLQCQSEVAHNTPSSCNNNITKAPGDISPQKPSERRRKKLFEEAAPQHVHEGRPSRHREKPTKFKDYDTELDFIRRERPRQTSLSDDEKEIEAEESSAPRSEGEISKTDSKITSDEASKRDRKRFYVRSKTVGNQKRRTYDKLIQHLTQATEQEGYEIQSVLFSLKSSVYKDQKVSKIDLLTSEQGPKDTSNGHCVLNGIKSDRPFQITGHKSSQNGETTSEAISKETTLSSFKSGLITRKWGKTFYPQLKSFPRKFPSSLRSSATPCLLQDSLGTEQAASQKPQPLDTVLNKYRIISPSLAVFEDAHKLHNNDSDPDYDPENFGDDVEKKKAKRKRHLVNSRKTKVVTSSGADSDRLLDKFQVLHASAVKQGDQFIIPQNTSVREGKMNTMLIGPFRLMGSGEESGIEIVPEHERAGTPNVLYGDLHLPNATVWGLEGTGTKVIMHTLSTAALSATLDHDYTKGRHDASDIPKVPRTFLKPIRMAQHISARVEKVEEGEGKSLVTISGHNNKAKSDAGILTFTPRINAEGIPIADCLEDVMTDTIRRVEKDRESYQKALEAKPTEPEVVGVNDMPVAGEVVLKAWGQIPNNKRGIRRNWIRGRPRKHLPLAAFLQQGVTKTDFDGTGIDKKNITITLQDAGSNVVVTMQGEVSLPGEEASTEDLGEGSLYVSSGLEQEENVVQGIIGANFKPGEINVMENGKGKSTLFTDSEVKLDIASDANVSEKSDKGLLSSSQAKIPKMCNYCLRLFPGPVLLYRHVKNDHSMYFKDAGYQQYLEDLRLDKHFVCPFCPGRHSLSNEYRFRAHLTQVHKVEIKEQSDGWKSAALSSLECEICHVYFQSWGELEVHATCVHDSHLLSCPHCSDAFILENTLCQHLKMHNTKKAHITEEEQRRGAKNCRFSHTSRGAINRPKRLKHGVANASTDLGPCNVRTQQSCLQCGKLFKTAGSLARHVETRHSSIEEGETQMSAKKQFQCVCCLEQFTSLWEAQEHQEHVHTSATLIHCIFCGAECTSVSSMYTHISECHLLTEMLACPICQDQLLSQKALAQHIYSIHGLECGESLDFVLKQNLDEVSDKGTDDCMQNLQCPYCTDIFTQTSLAAHIVEDHREQFPHTCPHCEQTFLTKEVLQHHKEFAHDYNSHFQSLLSPQSPKKKTMGVTLTRNQMTSQQGVTGILKSCHSNTKPGILESFVYSVGKQDIQALLTGETGSSMQQVTICPEAAYQLSSHFNNSDVEQSCDVEYLEIVTDDSIAIATDVIAGEGESAVEDIVYGMQLSTDVTDGSA